MSLNAVDLRRLDVLKDINEKCLRQRKEAQIIGIRPRQVRRLATGEPIKTEHGLRNRFWTASACHNFRGPPASPNLFKLRRSTGPSRAIRSLVQFPIFESCSV